MGIRQHIGAVALVAILAIGQGVSLQIFGAQAAGKLSVAEARKTILSGIKAFESGSMKKSVTSLSYALSSGGLSSKDMAKALYYRGRAYHKQGKHAQAISDLTSAIWLKNGLSDAEKTKAVAERDAAYKTAGVASPVPSTKVSSKEPTKSAAVPVKAATPQPVVAKPVPTKAIATVPKSKATAKAVAKAPAKAVAKPAKAAAAPVRIAQAAKATPPTPAKKKPVNDAYKPPRPSSGDFTVGVPLSYQSTSKNLDNAPADQARASVANSAETTKDAGASANNPFESVGNQFKSVGNYVSNLFSSTSNNLSNLVTPNNSGQNGSLGVPKPGEPSGPITAVSAWSNTTAITTGSTTKPTRVAAVNKRPVTQSASKKGAAPTIKTKQAVKPSKPGGAYGLQVAVVKSRDEAKIVIAKLMQKHGPKFGSRTPSVDEQVFGSMGTFYRVQVPGYVNTREPKSVCSTLASDGYDCFVVKK